MKLFLDILMVVFTVLTIVCLGVAQMGDNQDAKALAGMSYLPAMLFGALDALVLIVRLLKGW